MAEILLLPFGSAGDVFPFIWLGRLLMARGHRVRMITACLFEDHARKAGLEFISLGERDEFEAMIRDPRIWKSGIGTKVVFEFAAKSVEPYLAAIESCGKVDLMLAPVTAFAARLAREKYGIPLITVHLQPAVFVSAYETPLLHAFLQAGTAPVVFTPGTGHHHAARFFETALALTEKLGCRAVFLTSKTTQVPEGLPPTIFVAAYAPFSALLPHASAFVHHGGIGTIAQSLAAGVPQLVVDMALDQHDNAERLERLGAGLSIRASRFSPEQALPLLRLCLSDQQLQMKAKELAARIKANRDAEPIVEWLEERHLRPS